MRSIEQILQASPRRATFCAFLLAGLIVVCGGNTRVDAGLIIPQHTADQIFPVCAGVNDGLASGSADRDTGPDDSQRSEDSNGPRLSEIELLGNDAGGASSTETGSNRSTLSGSAALHSYSSPEEPGHGHFGRWREVSLCLVQPPAAQMLDPPKARA